MVNWPKACIGCGEKDPTKLKDFGYTYRHRHQTGSYSSGYNQITTTYDVTSLPVVSFLCESCEMKARKRFRKVGITFLVIFLICIAMIPIGIEADFGELLAIPGSIGLFCLIGGLAWVGFRRHPETHFHKVRFNYRRQKFKFVFKSPAYAAIFQANNAGENIKVKAKFP
jgi:hypothetical protein